MAENNLSDARTNEQFGKKPGNRELNQSIPLKSIALIQIIALVAIIFAVVFSYMGVFSFNHPLGVYRILPGDILIDFIWIYIISIIVGVFVYATLPYLSILLWKMHRLFNGNEYNYHMQVFDASLIRKAGMKRLMVPALVSLGFSSSLSSISSIVNVIFVLENFDTLEPFTAQVLGVSMPLFFIMLLVACFIAILFAPAWLLEDAGVICERNITREHRTADVEGVGKWYLAMLKGFAGISTLVAYLLVVLQMVEWYQLLPGQIENSILFYLLPVVVVLIAPLLAIAPISVVYVLYELSLSKSISTLEMKMKDAGLDRIIIQLQMSPEMQTSE